MYPNWFLGRPVVSAICEQLFPNVTERTARDVLLMWSASKLKQRQSTWELRPSWNSIQTFYFGFDFRNSSRDIYSLSQLRAADTYTDCPLTSHPVTWSYTKFQPQRTPPMTSTWCQVRRTWLVFSQASHELMSVGYTHRGGAWLTPSLSLSHLLSSLSSTRALTMNNYLHKHDFFLSFVFYVLCWRWRLKEYVRVWRLYFGTN